MAGDLGYETLFVQDATHAFDRVGPRGEKLSADEVCRATAASIHGEFATVVTTKELLAE
jgi:nicotinamidase-related amidase